ncbi:hypothetical protein L2E82_40843 [Cichorium intybus]|uniref:Uncharacterized protein n=1 Tax=Cichorium intybus TaxID=13427 RepID=A0ACB9AN21_CICIN|nr:hypothetical protein L2E82_40843 [Cichorium intybus]
MVNHQPAPTVIHYCILYTHHKHRLLRFLFFSAICNNGCSARITGFMIFQGQQMRQGGYVSIALTKNQFQFCVG